MSLRTLIIGNSGSGKSSAARALVKAHAGALAHLELDEIVWEPKQIAVQRPFETTVLLLEAFLQSHSAWVIEGCYGELARRAAPFCTELLLLNPGRAKCLANNQSRPWEPHKYASIEAQQAMLPTLQAWVASYYEREDDWSYWAHRRLFDQFAGNKREIST